RGRVLRQSGDTAGALNEFTRALQIDPGYEAATQEIQITQHPELAPGAGHGAGPGGGAAAATPPPTGPSESPEAQREIADVSGPIVLKPLSDEPISMHIVEDTKV